MGSLRSGSAPRSFTAAGMPDLLLAPGTIRQWCDTARCRITPSFLLTDRRVRSSDTKPHDRPNHKRHRTPKLHKPERLEIPFRSRSGGSL